MKIKYALIAAGILIIAILSAIIITNWNKHLLFLTNGDIIEAERTWQSLNLIFYEQEEGTLYILKSNEVDEIISATFSSWDDWQIILEREIELKRGVFSLLLNKMLWMAILLVFCMYLATAFISRFVLHKKRQKKGPADPEKHVRIYTDPAAPDMEKIIYYFLNIYLLQMHANKEDEYRYVRLDSIGPRKTTVYDLQRRFGDRWQSRRMSLGQLSDARGAKSRCFYVIYDDHIAIKIPTRPVTDFDQYMNSIKSEKRIAEFLSPRACLTPKVSLMLKRIPAFVNAIGEHAKEDEQLCIQGLARFPEFQKFLKIGESFIFFMDLSKHFFLKHILEDIHDVNKEFAKEISNHQDMIWSADAFENRYGENTAALCSMLQKTFHLFDQQITDPDLADYQKKKWFADSLLLDDSEVGQTRMPVVASVILKKIKADYKDTFDQYKHCITDFARQLLFRQNRSQIEGICANLLDLLAWLGDRHVAMRDLKPENLLVVGDSSAYPHFLKSPEAFQIGLIDVETAAYADPRNRTADQPPLGWTLWYATPSHMMTNEVLERLYENVPYILHLQDWQATAVMIFETITGEKPLFHAIKTLAGISKEIPRYYKDTEAMIEFAKDAGPRFWNEASAEFKSRMREKESLLVSVKLHTSRKTKEMFDAAAARSTREKTKAQMLDIKSGISAYDLLECIIRHLKEVMCPKGWSLSEKVVNNK